jgi:hypothetical protein
MIKPGEIFKPRPELLLGHNVPRPLYGVAPRTVIGDTLWRKISKHVCDVSGRRCEACGLHESELPKGKTLHCHEIYAVDYVDGVACLEELISICPHCHARVHGRLLKAMVENGTVSQWYADFVNSRAEKILTEAGLPLRPVIPEVIAPWDSWHLLMFDGSKHYSLYYNETHLNLELEKRNAKMLARKNRT